MRPEPPAGSPTVAVSYAWKEEDSGRGAGVVEDFCTQLRSAGIAVMRDRDGARLGDSIDGFLREVGRSNFLCVFLSDAYLRSPYCMYELLIAWRCSSGATDEFPRRVRVCVLPDAEGIRSPEQRLVWVRHWQAERDRLGEKIREFATDGLAAAELELFRRIKQFAEEVNAILCYFADTLTAKSPEDFTRWVEESFPSVKGPTPAQQAEVYDETVREIDEALSGNHRLGDFLARATPGLVRRDEKLVRLDDVVHRPPFDACRYLEQLEDHLPRGLASLLRTDLDALEIVAGGVLVLGLNPTWVWSQRNLAAPTLVYPGLSATVPVGDGQEAHFIQVVVAALADSHVRLRRVFGEIPQTRDEVRSLPPPPRVFASTNEDQRQLELMAHFIANLTGETVDLAKSEQVRLRFNRVREIMNVQATRRHNPYYGTGPEFREQADRIRRFLQPEDFWLLLPSGDKSEDELLPRSVRALMSLHRIYDAIKTRRAQLGS